MSTQALDGLRRPGWLTFAAVILVSVGFLRIISAIYYFADSSRVNNLSGGAFGSHLFLWGLWDLLIALLALWGGFSLFGGNTFGRVIGYTGASSTRSTAAWRRSKSGSTRSRRRGSRLAAGRPRTPGDRANVGQARRPRWSRSRLGANPVARPNLEPETSVSKANPGPRAKASALLDQVPPPLSRRRRSTHRRA